MLLRRSHALLRSTYSHRRLLSSNRGVVVFDLQSMLCKVIPTGQKSIEDPECIAIEYGRANEESRTYVFAPHVNVLLSFLLDNKIRLAFFSAEKRERHESIVNDLLSTELIKVRIVKDGISFNMLSEEHMRPYTPKDSTVPSGKMKKDLEQLLINGETLQDIILVDDESFTTGDQPEVIKVESCLWADCSNKAKNNMYYLMGLFATYFERSSSSPAPLRLRDFIGQILPPNAQKYRHPTSKLQMDLTLKGLHLVRQLGVPEALLYGTEEPDLFDDAHSAPLSPKREQYIHTLKEVDLILNKFYHDRKHLDGNAAAFMRYLRMGGLDYYCKQMYEEEAGRFRSFFQTLDIGHTIQEISDRKKNLKDF